MSTTSRDYYKEVANKYFAPAPIPVRSSPVVSTQPAPVQQEKKKEDKGTVDAIFGGIGKAIEGAGNVLDLSGKYMSRPILGALSKGIASNTVQNALGSVGVESLSEEDAERIRNAESYTQAWRERAKVKGTDWWEEMIAEVVADPTTYATGGAVGAVRAIPWVADAAKASPAISRALQQAEHVVGLAERAQALPLTAPIAGVKKTIGGVDRLRGVNKAAPVLHPITGKPIGQGLLDPTKESVLVESAETAEAALTNARAGGMQSTLGIDPGQFGPSQLRGSQRIVDAQRATEGLRAPGVGPTTTQASPSSLANRIHGLNNTGLADIYRAMSKSDPLLPDVEREMQNRGLLNVTAGKNAIGQKYTVKSLDQKALDRSETARQQYLNTPGNLGARPQIVPGDLDATYENTMRFIRDEAGIPSGTTRLPNGTVVPQAQSRMEPFVKQHIIPMLEKNKEFADAPALWAHPEVRADLARALSAGDEREASTHLAAAFTRINAKQSARGLIHPWGLRVLDKYLPNIGKTSDQVNLPAFNRHAVFGSVVDDQHMVALEKMFQDHKVVEAQKRWEKARLDIGGILAGTPGAPQFADSTTAKDIHDAMRLMTPEDARKTDTFLKQWNLHPDTFQASAKNYKTRLSKSPTKPSIENYTMGDAWNETMVKTWADSTAAEMGIKGAQADPSLLGKLGWVPRAWREQALITPRYHLVNALDMGVKSLLYGVNPIESRGAKRTAESLGMQSMPRAVFVGDETVDLGQITRPAEFMAVGQKSALPGPLGAISKFNRALARGTENTFREWAWDNGMMDTLQQYKPMLHDQIRRAYPPGDARADAFIADLEEFGTFVEKAGKRIYTKRDQGVLFSPEQLNQLAQKHGMGSRSSELSRGWASAIQQGSENGVNMSNRVHFDFDKTYNLEDKLFLKKWMPFHFFATRNIPFYMETLANRPEIVNAWMAYQDVSEQDRIEMGLPDRFEGMVPIGDGFLDRLLGPGKVFFNPMAAISFADQTKNVGLATEGNEFEEPAKLMSRKGIGGLVDRAANLGVGGPAPWIQIPLSIVGVTSKGAKDETMPILRHSGLADAAFGFDLGENQARGVINEFRSMFHNGERVETHTGSQFRDNQIVTKMQETMQTMIDKGLDPTVTREQYTQASKDGPGNPLWDSAAERVQQEEKARQFRGFTFPFPAKDISEEGHRLHQAREAAPEGALGNEQVVDLLKHFGDPSVANRGFRRPGLVDRQGDPIFVNRETGEREEPKEQGDIWGGENWGPDRQYPYNSPVVFRLYQQWKQSAPEDARIGDFFNAVPIPGR